MIFAVFVSVPPCGKTRSTVILKSVLRSIMYGLSRGSHVDAFQLLCMSDFFVVVQRQ